MRKPKRLGVAIDMTPMVDVAFLLLIFFMTTTTFKPPEEITIDLPASLAELKVPETGRITISLTRDAKLFGQTESNAPLEQLRADQVASWVQQARSRKPSAIIVVRADKNCEYGAMEDLMTALQEASANRFVLMTEGESEQVVELPAEGAARPVVVPESEESLALGGGKRGASRRDGTSWAR